MIGTEHDMPASLSELLARLEQEGIRDHRRYEAVRSYLSFRAREEGIPISGSFELTPLCNLNCKMCYVHLTRAQLAQTPLLRAPQWEELMQQAIDAGMLYAKLTGGECLTHPDFRRLYLFLRGRGVETGLLTNGVLLDADTVSFLKDAPPASIQITLYGADEDTYERVTGQRVFSVVTENIRQLQACGLPVSIAVTPNAYMTDGEEILRLVHGMGLNPRINFGLMTPRTETGRVRADAELDTYIRLFRLNRTLSGASPATPCEEADLPQPGSGNGNHPCGVLCGAGRNSFSIAWNGDMRPCNTFPQIKENARTLGFAEAWRRIHEKALCFPRPAECESCAYQARCGCCVAEHASGAPIGHANAAVCERVRRMTAEGLLSI